MAQPPETKQPIDWEAARLDYETGLLNMSEIGRKYGCTPPAVREHRIREQWTKNLSKAVRNETTMRLAQELVDEELNPKELAQAQLILNAAAEQQYRLAKKHRTELVRLGSIIQRYMETLECGTYRVLDKNGKEITAVIDVKEATALLSAVTKAVQTVISLERESYNMGGDNDDPEEKTEVHMDIGSPIRLSATVDVEYVEYDDEPGEG